MKKLIKVFFKALISFCEQWGNVTLNFFNFGIKIKDWEGEKPKKPCQWERRVKIREEKRELYKSEKYYGYPGNILVNYPYRCPCKEQCSYAYKKVS